MDEKWLTYEQAGDLLGMSADAARSRSRRRKWRSQRGNDGKTLILVPEGEAGRPTGRPDGRPTDQPAAVLALNDLVTVLRETAAKLEGELERTRAQHQAEFAKIEAKAEADRARHDGDIAWHRAEIDRLRKIAEARPWWRRLRGR